MGLLQQPELRPPGEERRQEPGVLQDLRPEPHPPRGAEPRWHLALPGGSGRERRPWWRLLGQHRRERRLQLSRRAIGGRAPAEGCGGAAEPGEHVLHEQLHPVPLEHPAASGVLPHRGVQGLAQQDGLQDQGQAGGGLRTAPLADVAAGHQTRRPAELQVPGGPVRRAVQRLRSAGLHGAHRVRARRPEGGLQPGAGHEAIHRGEGGRGPAGRGGRHGGAGGLQEEEQLAGGRPLRRPLQVRCALPRADGDVRPGVRHLRSVPLGKAAPGQLGRAAPDPVLGDDHERQGHRGRRGASHPGSGQG
mmetsp:Transcript_9542/g.29688  ORF Transcript_9542/g.29688 Transcript_9542/m.29688 type:complete len:304 (+) Transcript_9542:787-1698(+)